MIARVETPHGFVKRRFEELAIGVLVAILGSGVIGGASVWYAMGALQARATSIETQLSIIAPRANEALEHIARVAGTLEGISETRRLEIEHFVKRSEDLDRRIRALEARRP